MSPITDMSDITDIGDKMDERDIADKMAEAADFGLSTPYSLICDAWDILHMAGITEVRYEEFKAALTTAIQAFDANQIEYRFNDRSESSY